MQPATCHQKGVLVVEGWQVVGEQWQVGDNLGDNLDEAYSASISGFLFVGGRCDNFSKNLYAQDKSKGTNIGAERCIGITIGTTCHTCHTCHRQATWYLGGEA